MSPLGALDGVRIVDLTQMLAGPYCTMLLADQGADVIKVEAPAGDPMRNVFGAIGMDREMPNPAYTLDNRGKRSLVLDLRDDADRARMEALLADAHVFLTNLKPDVLDKFGLDPGSTSARHPHLVYCSVTGYGLAGPDRERASYDLGANAYIVKPLELARLVEVLTTLAQFWLHMVLPPPQLQPVPGAMS